MINKYTFVKLLAFVFLLLPNISLASFGCMDYGMAYEDYSGYCKCMSGYVWGKNVLGDPYCISGDTYCYDKYGYGSQYDSLSSACECKRGYVWDSSYSGQKCVSCSTKYGYGATSDLSGNCECMSGYVFGNDMFGDLKCIDADDICHDKYGYNSKYDSSSDKCECSSGYEFTLKTSGGLECESCSAKYGYHSSYDYISKNCKCDSGYTLDSDNKCVEKQNNVYFVLKELDSDNDEAVIQSVYDNNYYHVEYRSGCYSSSFDNYLDKQIVVNLGTDYSLDVYDKIILQDDNETCEISSVDEVDSDFTLTEDSADVGAYSVDVCNLQYGASFKGLDGKCYCILGYVFNNTSNKCEANSVVTKASSSEIKIAYDAKLANKLKGKILLQVEDKGQAWYVHPQTGKKHYMADGSSAYEIMRKFGSGITTKDLDKIKNNTTTAKKHSGKIFLQVESHGEAYYIDFNGKAHYLKDGNAAYTAMRELGLGIKNDDLRKIEVGG